MDLGVKGKTALVTASSKGLGRGAALSLAREGANVVICARGEEALRATEDDIRATGAGVLALVEDITDPQAPGRLVHAAVDTFGSVDILVANAGGPPPMRALEADDDAIRAAVEANLLTSIRLVRASIPHMTAAGWGRICLMTSVAVKEPIPSLALSNTARTGLWAWAKTAARDLFPAGITLNLICPGLHATDRVKVLLELEGPLGDPTDFGEIVAFLCSRQAAFLSGAALQVDGAASAGLL